MREDTGDLWTYPAQVRCVTTNSVIKRGGRLVMGAGVAKQAVDRFPDIDLRLASLVRLFGNIPFYLEDIKIMSFPTKDNWRFSSKIRLILASAEKAMEIANSNALESIVMTRPGCGNGGLDWDLVRPQLAEALDDRFLVLG